jgi:hypothetical protein
MKKHSGKKFTSGGLLRVAVYLPNEVYQVLKIRAEKERRSISAMTALILEENLKK